MDAAPDTRRQLGQIMVEEGFLTEDQLQDALAEQDRSGTPIGKVLVDLGFVSPGAVANALAEQHGGLLRTEYGTSAGLREMNGRPPMRTDAPPVPAPSAAPAPQAPPPAPPLGAGLRLAGPVAEVPAPAPAQPPAPAPVLHAEPQPEPPAPQPPAPQPVAPAPEPDHAAAAASSARIQELESQLHAVLTERNSLTQSFNELQARLSEAAQAHETSVSAEVSERIGSLESQLQAAVASREEVERARQHAGTHIAELQALLQSATAELEQLRSRGDDGLAAQLQEAAEQRDAAEQRAHALENDLAQLRDHVEATLRATTAEKESEAARAAALEAELASLREQAAGVDESLNARVVELEDSRRQLTSERDAAVTHAAEVEAEVDSLRSRLSEVPAPEAGPNVDVADLRQRLGARERRLAESVGEIAKMNREHRALLQLVERQFQLEEASTSVPEPKSEAVHVLFVPSATGYTLVERDGPAPDAGELVEVDGERFEVRRLGPSPLPGPSRRCAYLERA